MNDETNEHQRLNRIRSWFLGLIVVVVFFGALVPVGIFYWAEAQIDEAQFSITCVSARANIDQLQALEEIANELGVPHKFTVPDLPEECDGR